MRSVAHHGEDVAGTRSPVLLVAVTILVGAGVTYAFGTGDIPALWAERAIRPVAMPYIQRFIEYPPGVGLTLWLVSFVARSALATYLVFTVIAMILAATTAAMVKWTNPRGAFWWAVSPQLALYGVHNFDLLAIGPSTAALVLFERGSSLAPGFLLGFGASAKVYPATFMLCAVVALLVRREHRRLVSLLAGFSGSALLLNLPILVASPGGWWSSFAFQVRRRPTWGSLWFYAFHDAHMKLRVSGAATVRIVNVLSLALCVLGITAVLASLVAHPRSFYSHCCMALIVFVLANKIYSPQYDLWLLPLLALVEIDLRPWVVLAALDAVMFVVVFSRLPEGHLLRTYIVFFIVTARCVLLVSVFLACWKRRGPRFGGNRPSPSNMATVS